MDNYQSGPSDATKVDARRQMTRAIKEGRLFNPRQCAQCLTNYSEGHHPNYAEPLIVVWLCKKCHRQAHPRPKGPPVRHILKTLKGQQWSDAAIGAELGTTGQTVWRWRHDQASPLRPKLVRYALQQLLERP